MSLPYKLVLDRKNGFAIALLERFNNPWTGEEFYSIKDTYRPFAWYYRLKSQFAAWVKKATPAEKLIPESQTPAMQRKVADFVNSMKANPGAAVADSVRGVEDAVRNTGASIDNDQLRPLPNTVGKIIVDADVAIRINSHKPPAPLPTDSDKVYAGFAQNLKPHINWTFDVPVKKVPHV